MLNKQTKQVFKFRQYTFTFNTKPLSQCSYRYVLYLFKVIIKSEKILSY